MPSCEILVHTKTRRHEGLRTIDDASAAFFERGGAKIDEQSREQMEQPQIGQPSGAPEQSSQGISRGFHLPAAEILSPSVLLEQLARS
jgi:hypothetical protein